MLSHSTKKRTTNVGTEMTQAALLNRRWWFVSGKIIAVENDEIDELTMVEESLSNKGGRTFIANIQEDMALVKVRLTKI